MSNLFNGARPLLPVSERQSVEKAIYKIRARRQGTLKSLKSAWPKFNDAFCDGLEWRTITVVGARPGTGKTLFMEQLISDIIANNSDQYFRVLKFQMEMVDETSGVRKLSLITSADYNTLMSKDGKQVDKRIYDECVKYYQSMQATDRINVVYDACTVDEMCATIHYEMDKYKNEDGTYNNMLVGIDHSALFKVGKGQKDKFEMLGSLGEALTMMKKKYPIAFIVLSQLNRNIDDPKRQEEGVYGNYVLDSDIYGSDALLQHADVVMGINKPSVRKIRLYGPEKFIIADEDILVFHFLKSRNGTTRISFFRLDRTLMRIIEVPTPPTAVKPKISTT
jgi:replicative DNA helicase